MVHFQVAWYDVKILRNEKNGPDDLNSSVGILLFGNIRIIQLGFKKPMNH